VSCACPKPASATGRFSRPTDCRQCGRAIGAWQLTESWVRDFYVAIGVEAWAEQALERLRRGGRDYGWLAYLGRDNPAGGIEELIDSLHYAVFAILDSYLAEEEGQLSTEDAQAVREHVSAGATAVARHALPHFEAARQIRATAA